MLNQQQMMLLNQKLSSIIASTNNIEYNLNNMLRQGDRSPALADLSIKLIVNLVIYNYIDLFMKNGIRASAASILNTLASSKYNTALGIAYSNNVNIYLDGAIQQADNMIKEILGGNNNMMYTNMGNNVYGAVQPMVVPGPMVQQSMMAYGNNNYNYNTTAMNADAGVSKYSNSNTIQANTNPVPVQQVQQIQTVQVQPEPVRQVKKVIPYLAAKGVTYNSEVSNPTGREEDTYPILPATDSTREYSTVLPNIVRSILTSTNESDTIQRNVLTRVSYTVKNLYTVPTSKVDSKIDLQHIYSNYTDLARLFLSLNTKTAQGDIDTILLEYQEILAAVDKCIDVIADRVLIDNALKELYNRAAEVANNTKVVNNDKLGVTAYGYEYKTDGILLYSPEVMDTNFYLSNAIGKLHRYSYSSLFNSLDTLLPEKGDYTRLTIFNTDTMVTIIIMRSTVDTFHYKVVSKPVDINI